MITFKFIGQAKGNPQMQADLLGLIREGNPTLSIGPLQPDGTFSAEVTQSQATSIIGDIGDHYLTRVVSPIPPALLLVAAVAAYYLLR